MLTLTNSWRQRLLGLTCAAALVGCSSSQSALTQSSAKPASPMRDRQSTLVPGTADSGDVNELRNPARVHVAYARWQEQQKQTTQARDSYQKALSHDPKSVDALLGLSRLDQLAGRHAEAEAKLTRAEEVRPNSGLVSAAWAEYYASQQRWSDSVSRYQQAITREPTETLYKHQLAVALAKSGQINAALTTFTPLVGEAEAHYNVGYLLHQQGQAIAAEEQFQRALALKPGLATAEKMLARSRRERGLAEGSSPVMTASATAAQPVTAVQPAAWQPRDAAATHSVPQPPPGLSQQQYEQWQNQRATGH
jgi:tetratricopeptide (TPR) repeat protein